MTMTDLPVKPDVAPVQIWRCRNKECKAFIRAEMASSDSPSCPLCQGAMIRGYKHLPKLVNRHQAPKRKPASDPGTPV